jgi:hypothetical protein
MRACFALTQPHKEPCAMNWTTPTFEEIKMDAEIGSYQEDGEPMPIVRADEDSSDSE